MSRNPIKTEFGRENFYVILRRNIVTNSRVTPSWREIVSLTFSKAGILHVNWTSLGHCVPHRDVPSTSNRLLIELENQVQRLMEAHLAPCPPVQVNKISSSCEIFSGPRDTQYYMENPEQTLVDYASSRTDEARGELQLLEDFYVIDMEKDPTAPLPVARGFLATTSAATDYKKAKIAVEEGVTSGCFDVGGSSTGCDWIDESVGYDDRSLPDISKAEFSKEVLLNDGGSSSSTSLSFVLKRKGKSRVKFTRKKAILKRSKMVDQTMEAWVPTLYLGKLVRFSNAEEPTIKLDNSGSQTDYSLLKFNPIYGKFQNLDIEGNGD
ncbi:hypothetical protein Tco_0489928 [Tanacetum coccineum]